MADTMDRAGMQANATGITNLLRMARSECRAMTAFASLALSSERRETLIFPEGNGEEGLSSAEVAELVRQVSRDPEFGHTGVFLRTVTLDEPLALAVAPVRDGKERGLLAVAGLADHGFDQRQLAYVDGLAQRLARHLRVREDMERAGAWGAAARSGESRESPAPEGASGPSAVPAPVVRLPASEPASEPGPPLEPAPSIGSSEDIAAQLAPRDPVTGLDGAASFFSRAGRLLGAAGSTSALAVVLVEVAAPQLAPVAAKALRSRLRASDLLARLDATVFAAAVPLFPGSTRADAVEERLAAVAQEAVARPVRTAHVLVDPQDGRQLDQYVAAAMDALRTG